MTAERGRGDSKAKIGGMSEQQVITEQMDDDGAWGP